MSIRIVHTADNHIGMGYSHLSEPAKGKLVGERLDCLKRIIFYANKQKAHFLVVAGDLFDKITVAKKILKETGEALSKFDGEAVLIIPGNHDFYTEDESSIWKSFSDYIDERKVFILSQKYPKNFSIGETEISFFPAACHSKHSKENMIGWVKEYKKNPSSLNIGIAHGNVDGLGLDNVDRYFTMTKDELKKSGVDFWLLGHIHVPYPTHSVTKNPDFFFSATHTPDGFGRKHSGHFWYIEVDEDKKVNAILNSSDSFSFMEINKKINSFGDFENLKTEMDSLNRAKTALKLTLTGRLDGEQREEVEKYFDSAKKEFLLFERNGKINLRIDKKYIDGKFANDSLQYKLMSALVKENDDGLALQLCNELIESQINAD